MASIEQKRPGPRAATETMRAAVVEDFARPLVVKQVAKPVAGPGQIVVQIEARAVPHRHPRRARRLAGQADPAVHPRTRRRRHRRAARPGRHRGHRRRPRGDAVAGLRMRHMRVLRLRLGDALRVSRTTPATGSTGVRRVRAAYAPARRQRAGRHQPGRGRAAHLRRGHHVQGGQGRRTRPDRAVAIFGIGGLGHLALQYARIVGGRVSPSTVTRRSCSWPRSSARATS